MSTIRGIIRDGKVVLDGPVTLPEGTQVTIATPLPADDDNSPEAIQRRLVLMDAFGAWMSEDELAAWERVRAEDKAFQLSQWEKWSRGGSGPWQ
ncbi:hypothetical protein GobsT_02070 [Gemmata obscuriglobus]|uniref:Uncharacterized protein n=1 Tax=Gemmata obscuriglobus TaxID=114 RepID=A0A2Z3H9U4_9BACT|nr:hypothetical protein [Gemmata obscuriglobus]AWM41182.1 hypothetical protein C1280_32120 [Gemmata obscuriglobus]QEG25481.1 hypothetical protein GobsT_02070 [Gemmata obscuriglobus]VTR98708.1 unnamed protein product [Gemmata obscuriglobus UQM 2246]